MDAPPPDAVRSPDGHYWWDESTTQWQLIDHTTTQAQSDPTATGHSGADGELGAGHATTEAAIAAACIAHDVEPADVDAILAAAGITLEEHVS